MDKHNHQHEHTDHKHEHDHTHEHGDHAGHHEHKHDHPAYTHTHEHDHGHSHTHEEHTHEYSSDDLRKLSILLDHWVGHNEDHGSEFEQWANKAKGMGKAEVAEAIMEAVSFVKKANESLQTAKGKL